MTCLKCHRNDIINLKNHILIDENMAIEDYTVEYKYGGVRPKCVCGNEVKFIKNLMRFRTACCNAHINLGKHLSEEHKNKLGKSISDTLLKPEHRQRNSNNLKKRWESGEIDKLLDIDRSKLLEEEKSKNQICLICNKRFKKLPTHTRMIHNISYADYLIKHKYNGMHPKCICGKETNYRPQRMDFATCCKGHSFLGKKHSNEIKELIHRSYVDTVREKYGVDNLFQLPETRAKARKTSVEKYGCEFHQQNENQKLKIAHPITKEIRDKARKTSMEKYGSEYYSCTENGKQHIKNTTIEHYGVDNPMKNKELVNKEEQTKLRKYGYTTEFGDPNFRRKYNCGQPSGPQMELCHKLGAISEFILENKEFDMLLGDTLIEVDNPFHHPSSIENLTISQINTLINDKSKLEIATRNSYKLVRIRSNKTKYVDNINSVLSESYIPNYVIGNNVIMDAGYLKSRRINNKLCKDVKIIKKFVKEFLEINISDKLLLDFLSSDNDFTKANLQIFIECV
jgi:hypothetical protein